MVEYFADRILWIAESLICFTINPFTTVLSTRSSYGLRTLYYLAARPDAGLVSISEMGQELGVSKPYLAKVVRLLTHAGWLRSRRGSGGGVALARGPEEIRIADVLNTLDGSPAFPDCLLGKTQCDPESPCPLHIVWSEMRDEWNIRLASLTLSSITLMPAFDEISGSKISGHS